jgi:hypothetical protein
LASYFHALSFVAMGLVLADLLAKGLATILCNRAGFLFGLDDSDYKNTKNNKEDN